MRLWLEEEHAVFYMAECSWKCNTRCVFARCTFLKYHHGAAKRRRTFYSAPVSKRENARRQAMNKFGFVFSRRLSVNLRVRWANAFCQSPRYLSVRRAFNDAWRKDRCSQTHINRPSIFTARHIGKLGRSEMDYFTADWDSLIRIANAKCLAIDLLCPQLQFFNQMCKEGIDCPQSFPKLLLLHPWWCSAECAYSG